MATRASTNDLLASVRTLVSLSTLDLFYADQYLHRAATLFPATCTRETYQALWQDQQNLPRLTKDLRQATDRGDWSTVRTLAQQAAETRRRVLANSQLFAIADAVYGPRLVHADATTLALTGVVVESDATLTAARDAVLNQLRTLAAQDQGWSQFYAARVAHFERLQLVGGDKIGPVVDRAALQKRILEAVAASDFARVQQLTESVATEGGGHAARLHVPRPAERRAQDLVAAFPEAAVSRAREFGLVTATLKRIGGLNAYLSCACTDRASLPDRPLTETHREVGSCTCGHACPPEVDPGLRENLDLLMGRPFITSAATHYLPWFGPETFLVETFPETESDAPTGLSQALGLRLRHGVTRTLIEDALLTHGPDICTELGLDPTAFTVACIPFDAYLRLAPQYGWGQQELWTHFDGYQLTRELQLWALVGGNARYGGPSDLCALARDYDSERLTARFAVLRRERFVVRETQDGDVTTDTKNRDIQESGRKG